MILVNELKKPYTDKQRADFIVLNNHQHGYVIEEDEISIKAYGYDEDEIKAQEEQIKQNTLNAEAEAQRFDNVESAILDLASSSAVSETNSVAIAELGTYIAELQTKIDSLNDEIKALKGE